MENKSQVKGQIIIDLLRLKEIKGKRCNPPRYETDFGSKTAEGLYKSILRVLKNHELCIKGDPTEALKALNILENDANIKTLQKATQEMM